MSPHSTPSIIRTLDGLNLAGTLVSASDHAGHAVLLVHGGGVTREEGGFFTRLSSGLAEAGAASLRYDLRGHGESDGLMHEATLSAHLNDIRAALSSLGRATQAPQVSLIGASFGAGLCTYYTAKRSDAVARLVLLNPQLNYKNRYIDQKAHWHGDHIDNEAARQLLERGFIEHSPTVRHGRAMLNEVFWIKPVDILGELVAPTLIVHGTEDTFVPIEASREASRQLRCINKLVEVEGAQHGFAVHDDPEYLSPQTREWQTFVIETVVRWIMAELKN